MIKNIKSLFDYFKSNFAEFLNRCATMTILTAMLVPVFLFQPFYKISAKTLPIPQTPAVISAPPEAFIISDGNSLSSQMTSAFGSLFPFANKTVSRLFDKPQIPAGLEQPENQLIPAQSSPSENNNSNLFYTLPAGSVRFDFDGDGKADIARWHASNTEWKIKKSSNGSYQTETIGSSSSIPAPGDFDGDGKTDVALFNSGTWTIKRTSDNQTITVSFGASSDKPVVGDYDGDGLADCAVYRPSTNTWWILQSSNSSYTSTSFGTTGDITAQGNFDGDNKTDIAVFRPSTGYWHVQGSTAGYFSFHWGIASDIPVPADFDGDGKTDFAVYRGSTGTWYASKSSTSNSQYITQAWGNFGDQPAPADYDGDGIDDFAVWRPTTGIWYIIKSSNSSYDYPPLGQAGDTAISSAYLKQIGGLVYSYDFARTRLSPKNATGGTDLYSRNFSWGTGLVGLPGRAGLDAGFGISYNSLVWTKDTINNAIVFDADNSNVTPGFRMGFPTVEPVYYDASTGKFAFLMVTPSGGRVEFRQTAASDVYETADSSYAQLKINNSASPNDAADSLTLTVTTTDGTKSLYEWKNGAYRCQKITDRNGNYIEISHDTDGKLQTVTDTLGRVVTVNYNGDNLPSTITQTWKDTNGEGSNVTHTWASFTYTMQAITTNFSGSPAPTVVGPGDGFSIKVLQKITFPTETNGAGPNTVFSYNSWGQVKQITNYAADNHQLNYTKVNLPADATNSQADCPRFTETRNWIENFNLDENDTEQETVITNSITENSSYSLPDSISGTATKIEVSMTDHPQGAVSKTFVGSSGWMEGLPIATEDWANGTSGSERKRWTWTSWTQDDTNLSYIQNPRVIESKVGDTTNIKRSTTEYYPVSQNSPVSLYGLVKEVKVYASDESTVLKKVYTEYNLDSAYTSRRIIGLPSLVEAFGLNQQTSTFGKVSKVSYQYDEGNFSDSSLEQNISSVIKHDTNYGSSFITGRGNLTSTTRYDVTEQTDDITSSVKYNIAGAPVARIDPLGRTIKIGYGDNFNDTTTTRNTYAYPTKLTELAYSDSDNNFSVVKYRFDTGVNVWAKSPKPAGNSTGKETTRLYDAVGRFEKETIVNTGAYTRYEYPTNNIQSKVYAVINDVDGDNNLAEDEVYSESWTDGAGRVRKSRTELPDSTGGWTGTLTEYNILGQVTRSTVPTEINSSYEPAGDDATRGWLWTSQEYDWKGRVTRSIPTDSNGSDGKDQLISYDGCGCAGGQITTIQDALVPRDDYPSQTARRTQKIYEDILGRAYKTEVYNWDGSTVYSTVKTIFNGRDQAVEVKEYQGADTSSTVQTTTATFDGHGRLKTSHRPEQQHPDTTPAYTTYNYNEDDTIESKTDARGVVTSYEYNYRGQVDLIHYTLPQGANPTLLPLASDVSFEYDALGNRISMEDALGTVSYEYNSLSQMTAETRQFSETMSGAPLSNNRYKLEYSYALSGGLKSYKDPFGVQIDYSHDKTGRLSAVTGSGTGGSRTYASNPNYRAWGALKHLEYGNGTKFDITNFNNKLQGTGFEVKDDDNTAFIKKQYQFYNDGSLKYIQDELNAKFDRSYKYDNLSRTVEARTGAEARGDTDSAGNIPYHHNYSYDAFGHTSQTQAKNYTSPLVTNNFAYVNNRKDYNTTSQTNTNDEENYPKYSESAFGYYIYNSAGQLDNIDTNCGYDCILKLQTFGYDGDGLLIKKTSTEQVQENTPTVQKFYDIRSTILGGEVVTELSDGGYKLKTYVHANGTVVATQYQSQNEQIIVWNHKDLSVSTIRSSDQNGAMITQDDGSETGKLELDPQGNNVGFTDWWYLSQQGTPDPTAGGDFPAFETIRNGQIVRHNVDGIDVPAEYFGIMTEFAFGSIFGLIERQARISSTPVGYRRDTYALIRQRSNDPPILRPGGDRTPSNRPTTADGETEIYGYLTVTSPIYSLNWSLNLSLLPQNNKYEPLPSKENFRLLLTRLQDLNNGDCRKFLNAILANLKIPKKFKIGGTYEDLFDYLTGKKNVGFEIDESLTGTEIGGQSGKTAKGPITFRPSNVAPKTTSDRYFQQMNYVMTLIHEMLHRAGKGHGDFAKAAWKTLSKEDQKKQKPPSGYYSASAYFEQKLGEKCKFDPYNPDEVKANVINGGDEE